jgi:hypothetical protein
MNLDEGQREFWIRNYYWLSAEFEKEIDASFPIFRLCKSGNEWNIYQFMQKLEAAECKTLARGILKRFFSQYTGTAGEVITDEEHAILRRFDEFSAQSLWLAPEIQERKEAEEKIKFASKRALRNAMVDKFTKVFGQGCVRAETAGLDPQFDMRCSGWIISTQLTFGRQESVIRCSHRIVSEAKVVHPTIPEIFLPATTFAAHVRWLVYEWGRLLPDDVEEASNAAIAVCGFFFDVAPKLLKGLEFERFNN